MNQKSLIRIAFAASLLVLATAATAHSNHDAPPKSKPETCEQLADRAHYSNDLSDPDIKALKDKCDAEAKKDSSTDAAKKDEQRG